MKILPFPLLHKKDFQEFKLIFPPGNQKLEALESCIPYVDIPGKSDLFLQTKKILEAGTPLDMWVFSRSLLFFKLKKIITAKAASSCAQK